MSMGDYCNTCRANPYNKWLEIVYTRK